MIRPPMFPTSSSRPFPFMNSLFPQQAMYSRPGMGGFLARLFSRTPAMPTPSSPFFSMPAMQNIASSAGTTGGGITGMLGNVQKMLGIAQNVVPMVQQYGPLIKNLPAMMKIFRELKSTDESEEEKEQQEPQTAQKQQSKGSDKPASNVQRELPTSKRAAKEKTVQEPRPSTPKLYI
ncbi:VrrA/YqfQ family protein [Anoxybacteroides tepidamans]|uniref:VrrA/YqfQ family protein n=1 Tax=Anoxybacteroides tepidamans TaxID=265948 RepID=UPI0004844720|nr:VrrA/YqfQ family protein [Anoxybacillus tepidamans]